MDDSARWRYGLWAVGMGLLVLGVCFIFVTRAYPENPEHVAAVLGILAAPVGTMVAAYFGVQVGAAGKKEAQDEAKAAHDALATEKDKGQELASALEAEKGQRILQQFKDRTPVAS